MVNRRLRTHLRSHSCGCARTDCRHEKKGGGQQCAWKRMLEWQGVHSRPHENSCNLYAVVLNVTECLVTCQMSFYRLLSNLVIPRHPCKRSSSVVTSQWTF